jgi:hypothetical protein
MDNILAQTMETVGGVVDVVDKAASANDRWLFIAALVLLLGFAAVVIKWLVTSLETKDVAHAAERKELSEKVLAANDKFNSELKAERTAARAERAADQASFLASLERHDSALNALTLEQKAGTAMLTEHVREVRDRYKVDMQKVIHEELVTLGIKVKKESET